MPAYLLWLFNTEWYIFLSTNMLTDINGDKRNLTSLSCSHYFFASYYLRMRIANVNNKIDQLIIIFIDIVHFPIKTNS